VAAFASGGALVPLFLAMLAESLGRNAVRADLFEAILRRAHRKLRASITQFRGVDRPG
jgi:hypothetical protein